MTREDLEALLALHDWSYDGSEDMISWRGGVVQRMKILKELKLLSSDSLSHLLAKYCPDDERIHVMSQLAMTVRQTPVIKENPKILGHIPVENCNVCGNKSLTEVCSACVAKFRKLTSQ